MINKNLISIALIISLMQGAVAANEQNGAEMRPSESLIENIFEKGFGVPWVGVNLPSPGLDMIFSQYYSIKGGFASEKHIEAPKKYDIKNETPATVYISCQMHAVPYTEYKNCSMYAEENALWIQGTTSWTQYARVPEGSVLSLLATSFSGGNGYFYEIDPKGILSKNDFYFFNVGSQIEFHADTIGRYILLFIIGCQVSNSVVIDVVEPFCNYPMPISPIQPFNHEFFPPSTPASESQGNCGYQTVQKVRFEKCWPDIE